MNRYNIGTESFSTKNEIIERCKTIAENNYKNDLTGNDLEFMINVYKFSPNKNLLINMRRIFIDLDPTNKYKFFYIEYTKKLNSYHKSLIKHAPYKVCINHIPFNEDIQICLLMPFGKYKNEPLIEIYKKDPQYIYWVLSLNISIDFKTKINQMIKYGYIPYNPVAVYK